MTDPDATLRGEVALTKNLTRRTVQVIFKSTRRYEQCTAIENECNYDGPAGGLFDDILSPVRRYTAYRSLDILHPVRCCDRLQSFEILSRFVVNTLSGGGVSEE